MARRRSRPGLGALPALALIAGLALAPVAAADPSPAAAIADLNQWRTELGEPPVSTTDVAAWDTGCAHHNNYEQTNGQTLSHAESISGVDYTLDGAVAGPNSVLAEEIHAPQAPTNDDLLPGRVWDSAVFHRAALLEPRLANIGFNSSTFQSGTTFTSFQCLWVQDSQADIPSLTTPVAIDNSRTTPALTLYPSPANGAQDVPTTFPAGDESPNPATETGVPRGATLGWLMNVEINGPWKNGNHGDTVFAHNVTATLDPDGTSNAVPVVVSECGVNGCAGGDEGGTSFGVYFEGGFGIFPTQPLAPNTMYRATATGTVRDLTGATGPYPFSIHWCFSTGDTYTPSADCSAAAAGEGGIEPVVVSSMLTVSVSGGGSVAGSGISCPGTCSHSYSPGSSVTLSASPASGERFVGWSGGCSGSSPTCSVTPAASTSVTATFARIAQQPVPSADAVSLGGKGRLAFVATAGTGRPALSAIVVVGPRGISFSRGTKRLARDVAVKVARKRVRFSVKGGRTLTIRLGHATRSAQITIGGGALVLSKALARKVRHHHVGTVTFTIKLIDAARTTSTLGLTFTFH